MPCSSQAANVDLFLDGQLTVEAQIDLFKHLAGCHECRDFLEKTNRLRTAARQEEPRFPEHLDRAIFEEIHRRRQVYSARSAGRHLLSGWRHPVAVPRFAVAALLILVLVLAALEINDRFNPPNAVPVYQLLSPETNPIGVIYIIAQPVPMPAAAPRPVAPDTTLQKGVPHEPQNPSIAAHISMWSAVLADVGVCAA